MHLDCLLTGEFTYVVGQEGTFHYWSGWVDEFESVSLRGTVTATARESNIHALSLRLSGLEASYSTNSGTQEFVRGSLDSPQCPSIPNVKSVL